MLCSYVSVPIVAPKLHIEDKYSLHEISLSWSKIQLFSESKGTVLEYKVQYWEEEVEMQPIINHKVVSLTTTEPQRAIKLVNLLPNAKYGIRVAAVTQAGIGKFTNNHFAGTELTLSAKIFGVTNFGTKFARIFIF